MDNLAWDLFRAFYIFGWFVGAGLVSAFILHFKPTRKLIKKYLPFLLTED
jgi:hypothetical protein